MNKIDKKYIGIYKQMAEQLVKISTPSIPVLFGENINSQTSFCCIYTSEMEIPQDVREEYVIERKSFHNLVRMMEKWNSLSKDEIMFHLDCDNDQEVVISLQMLKELKNNL